MDDKYLDVSKTYYVNINDENMKSNDKEWDNFLKEHPYIVTDIASVSDYLRAILLILSNLYILRVKGVDDIRKYEDLFSINGDDSLNGEVRKDGLFFRGENKEYNYQIPGLFRKYSWIKNEKEIIDRNREFTPERLQNNSIFDNLTLIQHYGGSTRILDISSNALIALFFAVSGNFEENGYVYLLSAKDHKIESPDSLSVTIKAAISELTSEQKNFLAKNLYSKKDSEEEVRKVIQDDGLDAVDTLYSLVQRSMNSSNIKIRVKDMFGLEFVQPYRFDNRIIQQSGAFIILGLEQFIEINSEKMIVEKIQKECSDQIHKLGLVYDPEVFIGLGSSPGTARIKIAAQYKNKILSELELLGINESTVYPDMQHKAQKINEDLSY